MLRFRSFVQEPMRWGSMALAGDAAYTAPPTGARGLNLALHDVKVLAGTLLRALSGAGEAALDDYQPRALERVRRAQNFSYWMTQLLHTAPGGTPFDLRRQLGELDSVVGTRAGRHLSRRAVHRLASRLPGLTPTTIRSEHVITNCHGHFTTEPPQLTQWREQQVAARCGRGSATTWSTASARALPQPLRDGRDAAAVTGSRSRELPARAAPTCRGQVRGDGGRDGRPLIQDAAETTWRLLGHHRRSSRGRSRN